MTDAPADAATPQPTPPRWQPLGAIDRRVLGVLGEKAKTTPAIYPMSLNAICTGCNQKSNRAPLMQLEPGEVEESLDRLREMRAVGLIEGYGRVAKYRHYLYEWLGVDKVEIAVMIELLLRGEQTIGELRGRAARMEPIPDLAALRPVLDSLKAKGLLVALTPEGRGQVVTHALYKPRELENLIARYRQGGEFHAAGGREPSFSEPPRAGDSAASPAVPMPMPHRSATGGAESNIDVSSRRDVDELRSQVAQLRLELEEVRAAQQSVAEEVRLLKDALGVA